jgi:hypothetical protein
MGTNGKQDDGKSLFLFLFVLFFFQNKGSRIKLFYTSQKTLCAVYLCYVYLFVELQRPNERSLLAKCRIYSR